MDRKISYFSGIPDFVRIIITIFLWFPIVLPAQDLHIKNTSFSVKGNVLVSVDKSMINRGSVVNDGLISIAGNWVNAGMYQDFSGLLCFDGHDLQYINHGEAPVNRVMFKNGRKHLSTNTYIGERITMSNTRLFVPPGSALYLNEGAVLDYSPGDRVIGSLFMKGNDLTFPVGTTDKFLPIRVVLPEGQSLEMGIKATAGLLSPKLENTISLVSDYYWEMMASEECGSLNVTLGFEKADFLNALEEAVIGEATQINQVVRNAGAMELSGSTQSGTITSSLLNGPFFTLAKKYSPGEKPLVNVLNLVTPDNDGFNDFLLIENIEAYPDNQVSVFDRWGTKLYEASGYNNDAIRFEGIGNKSAVRGALEKGTYFYLITSEGTKLGTGFFELVR